jgi:hypothetical protein
MVGADLGRHEFIRADVQRLAQRLKVLRARQRLTLNVVPHMGPAEFVAVVEEMRRPARRFAHRPALPLDRGPQAVCEIGLQGRSGAHYWIGRNRYVCLNHHIAPLPQCEKYINRQMLACTRFV